MVAWEPPTRLVLSWYPGRDPESATELEVRFSREADGTTRVDLEHRGWERLGDERETMRTAYDHGWDTVLARYGEAAG